MPRIHSLRREQIKLPTTHLDRSVREVQEELKDSLLSGKIRACPCCGLKVKVYPRGITKAMAKTLRAIYLNGPLLPKDMATAGGGSRDYAAVHAWGLAFVNGEARWQLTPKGRQFVEGKLSLPFRVLQFNGETLGFVENKTITFAEALREEFAFAGLMNPAAVTGAMVVMPEHGEPGEAIVGVPVFDEKRGRLYDRQFAASGR